MREINNNEEIKKYIGKAKYDEWGSLIWSEQPNGDLQRLADIRGWGTIQYKFETEEEAMKFQDSIGEFIVDAINTKLQETPQPIEEGKIILEEAFEFSEWCSRNGWTCYKKYNEWYKDENDDSNTPTTHLFQLFQSHKNSLKQ